MRLWSIHPRLLDRMGLLGLWREALHAQRILISGPPYTQHGWGNHPQMTRFKENEDSLGLMGGYLYNIYLEGRNRGYKFRKSLIHKTEGWAPWRTGITKVSRGQLNHEIRILLRKLELRDKQAHQVLMNQLKMIADNCLPIAELRPFPLVNIYDANHAFVINSQDLTIAPWETVKEITI